MKHGAYARTVPVIRAGPLKEDEEEVRAFYEGVVAEFKPGDSTILQAMAWDIASLQWSQVRLRKWEADGYSLPEDQVDVYQPDRNAYFAREREKAADVLERLGDPELASGDLRPALIALIQVTEVDRNLISTVESLRGRNQLLSVLLGFIRDHYRDTERAIQQLDLEAARHRNLERDRRVSDSFGAARTEAVSEFTRSLQDARARISRELDRAITRYQLTREALKRLE